MQNATFVANAKAIFESTDRGAYNAFCQEITKFKAAGNRLDSIVSKGVYAGINQLKATVSLNRLNALLLALRDCKESTRLTKLQRVPEYAGLHDCIAFDKAVGIFFFTDYGVAKMRAASLQIPATKYLDWLKANKKKKESGPIDLETATKKITTLYKALATCGASELDAVKETLSDYLAQYDATFIATETLERLRAALK